MSTCPPTHAGCCTSTITRALFLLLKVLTISTTAAAQSPPRPSDCKHALFDRQTGGEFYTVGFPKVVSGPVCFVYQFKAPEGDHVEVEVRTAEVPSPIGTGCKDFVRVYERGNGSLLDPFDQNYLELCGKSSFAGVRRFVSARSRLFLFINVVSTSSVRLKGVYRILKKGDYQVDGQALRHHSCAFRINALKGQVVSPDAPFYAPPNASCSYAFPSLRHHVLTLNVTHLEMPTEECHESFLALYRSEPRRLLERWCRSVDLPYVFQTEQPVELEFRTGPKERRIRGFRLAYEYASSSTSALAALAAAASSTSNTLPLSTSTRFLNHSTHAPAPIGGALAVGPAMWAAILGKPVRTGTSASASGTTHDGPCPVRVVSARASLPTPDDNVPVPWANNSGVLSSEHFVPFEQGNFKCQFVFVGAPEEHVQIVFRKFKLFAWKDKGLNSSMELRCDEMDHVAAHVLVGSRMSKIYDFCGSEVPPPLMSAKNILTLDYVVKSLGSRQASAQDDYGFVIEYRFLPDWGPLPPEVRVDSRKPCAYLFNGSVQTHGHFWSANHPGFYPRNLDCEYVFNGRTGQIVVIHFEYFDVEGFGQCEKSTHSDFVLFSNYMTTDRTNRRYCGSLKPPGAIASESNYFRMLFQTNDIFDGTGFYGHYQFIDQQSSQHSNVKLATGAAPRQTRADLAQLLAALLLLRALTSTKSCLS